MTSSREQLVGQAVFEACDPIARVCVARNEHPDKYAMKRAAERALRALRDAGHLPDGVDITVSPVLTTARGRFRLTVAYSPELVRWMRAEVTA